MTVALWRSEAEKVPKKLGLNDHDTALWGHLLDDVECLDRAVEGEDASDYLGCIVSLSFHEGELFQRGINPGTWMARGSLLGRIHRVEVPFWDTARDIMDGVKRGVSEAAIAPTAAIPRSDFPPEELKIAKKMLEEIERQEG